MWIRKFHAHKNEIAKGNTHLIKHQMCNAQHTHTHIHTFEWLGKVIDFGMKSNEKFFGTKEKTIKSSLRTYSSSVSFYLRVKNFCWFFSFLENGFRVDSISQFIYVGLLTISSQTAIINIENSRSTDTIYTWYWKYNWISSEMHYFGSLFSIIQWIFFSLRLLSVPFFEIW